MADNQRIELEVSKVKREDRRYGTHVDYNEDDGSYDITLYDTFFIDPSSEHHTLP